MTFASITSVDDDIETKQALEIALEQENRAPKLELKNIKRDQQNDYECAQLFMKDRDKMTCNL
ncbi:MAG: hypothetical protein P8H40_08335 [Winogradskyella sp.]|nr:hypothetical protein [Winogradskyella sp.]